MLLLNVNGLDAVDHPINWIGWVYFAILFIIISNSLFKKYKRRTSDNKLYMDFYVVLLVWGWLAYYLITGLVYWYQY